MRSRFLSTVAAIVAASLLSAAIAASASAGATIRVGATVPMTFSGLYVTAGSSYNVTATGYVMTAKVPLFHVPGATKSASGPAGQDTQCLDTYIEDVDGRCAMDGANFGELVGIIIDGDTGLRAGTVAIGAGRTFVAPVDGYLFLAANDFVLDYFDNNGQFEVAITSG